MSEETIEFMEKSSCECLESLNISLGMVENIVSQRLSNKLSVGKMSAVARELKELIKVVSTNSCQHKI